MNSKAKIIVVLFAFLGFASASYAAGEVTGTRDLPDSYVPSQSVTVSLDLEVDETRLPNAVILLEYLPAGWTITSATPNYKTFNSDTGEVKWLFMDVAVSDTAMDITYQVSVPSGETGDKTFSGLMRYNYPAQNQVEETIGGDTQISGPEPLPTVYFSSTSSNGSEADTDVTLDVELSAPSDEVVTVGYAVTGGTAAGEGEDYTLAAGTLTFSAGETSKNISIMVNDDELDEVNETIEVTLNTPTNATLGTNKIHTYTIQDDETQPSVEFEVASSQGPESVGTAELTVKLLPQSGLEVTVDYAVTDGDATSGEDYTLLGSGTLTFSAGDTSEKISITIINDLTDENNETIEVTLSNPTNAILGAEKIHTYTIFEDNEDVPEISFSSTGSQGDEGVSQVTMAVNLSPASAKTVTVSYTLSGDADEDVDYTISPPPLIFAPGETTKDIILSIVDDGLDETNETVTVTLSSPTNATLGAKTYTYTINDDDIAGIGFALVSSSGSESVADVKLVVGLSPVAAEEVTVDYRATGGGTATGGGVDYTLASGTLTFSVGDTSKEITITINDDSIYEGDETIEVKLSNPTKAELGNNITHTYTIVDDESLPIVEFDVGTSQGIEDNTPAYVKVNISGESTQDVEVDYSVTSGTAKAGQDYTTVSGTLTFSAGDTDPQTIDIPIIDDDLDEDDETFTVTLSNAENAILGTASHKYTILDNDDPPSVSFTSTGSQGKENIVSQVTLVVELSEETGRTVTVDYSVSGDADVDVDYTIPASPLIFAPGEITKNIILSIVNDSDGELDEEIIVTLDFADNAGPGGFLVYKYTILNDDKSSIEFADVSSSGPESDDTVTLPVTLLPAIPKPLTVNYSVTGGTATDDVDYELLGTGTLTFSPDSTTPDNDITITIKNDTEVEPDETIIVTLSGPSEDATIGTKASHTYTILNDDDETEPNTYGHIPEPDSIQVARDTIIQLHITDAMIASTSGVDLDTVKIQVEGVVIYNGDVPTYGSDLGTCRRVEIIEDEDYMFVFQPSTLFDYEQKVDVVVYAKDMAGNEIMDEYYFHTVMRVFGPNIKVNSDTGTLIQNRPDTAMDSAGNIWVVWDQSTAAGDTDIYISKLPADGSAFETSMPVISNPNNQRNPAIAIDASDVLYVVWEEFADPNWDILLLTSSDDGVNWTYDSGSDPCQVNADNPDDKSPNMTQNPAIAISGTEMYVTWDEKRGTNKDIWVRQSAIDTKPFDWKDAKQVTTHPSAQSEPAIAIDEFGTASIVWTDERNQGTSTDIYGADSVTGNWENEEIVKTSFNQWSPAIAAESSGTVLHLLWVDDTDPNGSIFYRATTDGLQGPLEVDLNVVDEPKYAQSAPAIAVSGTGETAKVFACWQDERNVADPDIYYAEKTGSDFGTNILVNDDLGANAQKAPVIGIDKNGNPYMGWVDNRLGNNDIYGAGATAIGPPLELDDIEVDANGVTTVKAKTIANLEVRIPTGALPGGIDADDIKIAEVSNLPEMPSGYGSFGIPFKFGPSGLHFNSPVTIRIPHDPSDLEYPVYIVYRYDPNSPTFWSSDGIHNPATHSPLGVTPHYLEVEVDHFSVFQPGGGDVGTVPGGGDGGGCEISPTGQGNVIEYMLPYVLLTVVWVIIKRKDARNRKTA